jgi:NAD(P)H-flavin reductase
VERPLADEVARYEGVLRRRAGLRAGGTGGGDTSLTELLRAVEGRRARRGRGRAIDAPRILGIDHYGPTVRVLRISRPAGFDFRPGQYLKLGVPGGKREDFSIASAPHEPDLELAIELRPGGEVTPALFGLGVGDVVEIAPAAKGGLRLDPDAAHHLMIATVTGIAPLRSMVRAALQDGTTATFTILLGASHAIELPFHDELAALASTDPRVRYVATVSRPGQPGDRAWDGAVGRVDALAPTVAGELDPATTRVYAVGHDGMIASVRASLGGAGFSISTESYGS